MFLQWRWKSAGYGVDTKIANYSNFSDLFSFAFHPRLTRQSSYTRLIKKKKKNLQICSKVNIAKTDTFSALSPFQMEQNSCERPQECVRNTVMGMLSLTWESYQSHLPDSHSRGRTWKIPRICECYFPGLEIT